MRSGTLVTPADIKTWSAKAKRRLQEWFIKYHKPKRHMKSRRESQGIKSKK